MTRVDFYVLPDSSADNRNSLICKLAEKAFRHDKPVFIHADDVQLSAGQPANDRRILINLAHKVPTFFSRFERALEIVNQSDAVRETARERHRFYQQRGYPLKTHKM